MFGRRDTDYREEFPRHWEIITKMPLLGIFSSKNKLIFVLIFEVKINTDWYRFIVEPR